MPPEQLIELQKKNCIFCRIAKKEIPAATVYDDDTVSCVLDINPATKGHTLILPVEHYGFMHLTPPEIIKKLFIAAQHVSQAQLKALQVQGTTIFVASGGAAGQRAPHFLFHVIPRDGKDGLFPAEPKQLPPAQHAELRRALAMSLPRVLKGNQLKIAAPPQRMSPAPPSPQSSSSLSSQSSSPSSSPQSKQKSSEDVAEDMPEQANSALENAADAKASPTKTTPPVPVKTKDASDLDVIAKLLL